MVIIITTTTTIIIIIIMHLDSRFRCSDESDVHQFKEVGFNLILLKITVNSNNALIIR